MEPVGRYSSVAESGVELEQLVQLGRALDEANDRLHQALGLVFLRGQDVHLDVLVAAAHALEARPPP